MQRLKNRNLIKIMGGTLRKEAVSFFVYKKLKTVKHYRNFRKVNYFTQ